MGTNSFHMIVCQASPERDHFEVITRVKDAVPFFRGALSAHYIDEESLKSAIDILSTMIRRAKEKKAFTILAVATSAVRESKNGEEALERIRQELKLDARMISGKEEARLIYLGVLWSMPRLEGNFAIVDIGGGSTEIILANRSKIHFAESYKLGAARLTQRFFRKDGPTVQTVRELHSEVLGVLRPAAQRINEAGHFKHLIGTSGTIQTLARIDRVRTSRKKAELHGYRLTVESLEQIVAYIEENSLKRSKIKGVSSDRTQTILAGSIVLLETMKSLHAQEIVVCTAALREGVVVDRFLQTGWLKAGLEQHRDPRSASVHATKGLLHTYSEDCGHLLWSAAMLHDVGMFIGRNGHHKHSYYLIKNGGMLGHSEEEVGIIASIARYHRGSSPKESHEAYYGLAVEAQPMVSDLASILRLAEALDRSHRQIVEELRINLAKPPRDPFAKQTITFNIKVKPNESFESEAWAFSEKKEFFEERFRMNVNLCVDTAQAVATKQ
jgi:exopolyphosphatase/guanosine-5'-triphosphate,3'-diphosphate pyrophosphatase